MSRYTPRTLHSCGCVTAFDTLDWRSVVIARCDFHAAQGRTEADRG